MRAIDNASHAIATALSEGLDLSQMVVTAWRRDDVLQLAGEVVRALGVLNPETELDDVIFNATVGTIVEVAAANSNDTRSLVDFEDSAMCVDEFVALIRRVAETSDKTFLAQAQKQVHAAIALSIAARLDCVELQDRYRKAPIEPALSLVTEVADYYRDFKQQCGMIDVADLLAGELEAVPGCALVLIGRAVPPLAAQALRRIFPQAFFCTCSLGHGGLYSIFPIRKEAT